MNNDYLGEAHGRYTIQKQQALVGQGVKMQWLPLRRDQEHVGDILAAFELVLTKNQTQEVDYGKLQIPESIAVMEEYTVEVYCTW